MVKSNSFKLANFEKAWSAIPDPLKPKVRNEIMTSGYINSIWKFTDRRIGRVGICELEAIAIIKVFKKYGIDAHTGNALPKVLKGIKDEEDIN